MMIHLADWYVSYILLVFEYHSHCITFGRICQDRVDVCYVTTRN